VENPTFPRKEAGQKCGRRVVMTIPSISAKKAREEFSASAKLRENIPKASFVFTESV